GVALLTKAKPLAVRKGLPTADEDALRRMIIADLETPVGTLTVLNGYFLQGECRDHPTKFPAKQKFYADMMNYLSEHHSPYQPIVIMGDMNISASDLDIGIGEENCKRWLRTGKCSFLPEERECMDTVLQWCLVDTFRALHPDT
ncbi:exodeoxyribonuclease III, partial [Plesiomonas shigelloides]